MALGMLRTRVLHDQSRAIGAEILRDGTCRTEDHPDQSPAVGVWRCTPAGSVWRFSAHGRK